jgi:chromosomal replication initiator protein
MQMVFDFPVHPRYGFDNFVVCGGNEVAYRFARMLSDGDTHNLLYIYGPHGSGKTHLLAALGKKLAHGADDAGNEQERAIPYISFRDIDQIYRGDFRAEQPSRLGERLADAPALLIDDLHLIPDNSTIRIELWQVFNDFFAAGRKIAITGLHPPRELPTLDDHLVSRLLWGLVAGMDVSDDDSRRLIMKKLAADRQMFLPADVIDYLLLHTSRDIPSLIEALETIGRFALAVKRKISVRLAREALLPGPGGMPGG